MSIQHVFISVLLFTSVADINAASLRVGISGSGMIPLIRDDIKKYDLTCCYEPFVEVVFPDGLSLSIALGFSTLDDEDNWWANMHRNINTTYEYSYNASERTASVLLKHYTGKLFFGAGMCYISRGFTSEVWLPFGYGYVDSHQESRTGIIFSTGVSTSSPLNSALDMVLQARIYGDNEIWLIVGTSLGFVL